MQKKDRQKKRPLQKTQKTSESPLIHAPVTLSLLLLNHSRTPMPRQFIHRWMEKMLPELRRAGVKFQGQGGAHKKAKRPELVIVLVDEVQGQQLNRQFRGKDKATDVLSFASQDSSSLGELVLCAPVVARQAQEQALSFRVELGYLILHGFLHLLGYEHEWGGAPAREMYRIQDQVFARLRELC